MGSVAGRLTSVGGWVRLALVCLAFAIGASPVSAQEPASPQLVAAPRLQEAIDRLGSLDYATRTEASKLIRRTTPAVLLPLPASV